MERTAMQKRTIDERLALIHDRLVDAVGNLHRPYIIPRDEAKNEAEMALRELGSLHLEVEG